MGGMEVIYRIVVPRYDNVCGLQSVHLPFQDIGAIHVRGDHLRHAVSKGCREEHEGILGNLEDYKSILRSNVEEG
jgi:hypothetical protein